MKPHGRLADNGPGGFVLFCSLLAEEEECDTATEEIDPELVLVPGRVPVPVSMPGGACLLFATSIAVDEDGVHGADTDALHLLIADALDDRFCPDPGPDPEPDLTLARREGVAGREFDGIVLAATVSFAPTPREVLSLLGSNGVFVREIC